MLAYVNLSFAFIFFQCVIKVSGNYPCVCSYLMVTNVYMSPDITSNILGELYEYDCGPTYPVDASTVNTGFIALQFRNQIGYIKDVPGDISIESCPGSISTGDAVTTTIVKTTPRLSTKLPSTTPNLPDTTSPTIKAHTTSHLPTTLPTTLKTTTKAPTTTIMPTTLKTTTKVPTATIPPVTLSTTTKAPTTTRSPTTLKTTTKVSTTTIMPTTLKTTTKVSTTTIMPTTLKTTTKAPATTNPPTTTTSLTTSKTTTRTTLTSQLPTTLKSTTNAPTTFRLTTSFISFLIPDCPAGWVKSTASCYKFLLDQSFTYTEAVNRCMQDNSHLVTITSQTEQTWLEKQLNSHYTLHSNVHNAPTLWTGAMIPKHSDLQWRWYDQVTQTYTSMDYTNWAIRPVIQANSQRDLCVLLSQGDHWTWWKNDCLNGRHGVICEKSAFPVTPKPRTTTIAQPSTRTTSTTKPTIATTTVPQITTVSPNKGTCPLLWVKLGDKCYFADLYTPRIRYDAFHYCLEIGGHEAFIKSANEQQHVMKYIKSLWGLGQLLTHHNHQHSSSDPGVWLGAYYNEDKHTWFWRASPESSETQVNYFNRAPTFGGYGNSIVMSFNQGYQWTNIDASEKMYTICERPLQHFSASLIG